MKNLIQKVATILLLFIFTSTTGVFATCQAQLGAMIGGGSFHDDGSYRAMATLQIAEPEFLNADCATLQSHMRVTNLANELITQGYVSMDVAVQSGETQSSRLVSLGALQPNEKYRVVFSYTNDYSGPNGVFAVMFVLPKPNPPCDPLLEVEPTCINGQEAINTNIEVCEEGITFALLSRDNGVIDTLDVFDGPYTGQSTYFVNETMTINHVIQLRRLNGQFPGTGPSVQGITVSCPDCIASDITMTDFSISWSPASACQFRQPRGTVETSTCIGQEVTIYGVSSDDSNVDMSTDSIFWTRTMVLDSASEFYQFVEFPERGYSRFFMEFNENIIWQSDNYYIDCRPYPVGCSNNAPEGSVQFDTDCSVTATLAGNTDCIDEMDNTITFRDAASEPLGIEFSVTKQELVDGFTTVLPEDISGQSISYRVINNTTGQNIGGAGGFFPSCEIEDEEPSMSIIVNDLGCSATRDIKVIIETHNIPADASTYLCVKPTEYPFPCSNLWGGEFELTNGRFVDTLHFELSQQGDVRITAQAWGYNPDFYYHNDSEVFDFDPPCLQGKVASESGLDITISPNPASSSVSFKGDAISKIVSVDVWTMMGVKVTESTSLIESQLDISNLSAGVYALAIQFENGTVATRKMVVK